MVNFFCANEKTISFDKIHEYSNKFFKLVQVAITIPIFSATHERAFSAMRRIKHYLRIMI